MIFLWIRLDFSIILNVKIPVDVNLIIPYNLWQLMFPAILFASSGKWVSYWPMYALSSPIMVLQIPCWHQSSTLRYYIDSCPRMFSAYVAEKAAVMFEDIALVVADWTALILGSNFEFNNFRFETRACQPLIGKSVVLIGYLPCNCLFSSLSC